MRPSTIDVNKIPPRTITIHLTGVDRLTRRLKAVIALLRLAQWVAPAPVRLEIEYPDPLPEPRPPQD